jgi:hypothetical protein
MLWRHQASRPSDRYCTTLGVVDSRVAETRHVIAERNNPAFGKSPNWPPDWATLRHMVDIIYPRSIVHEGPPGTENDARLALNAIRTAIDRGSTAPFDDPAFRAAAARLGPASQGPCKAIHEP